ncbi:sigma-70 family RNA polymerase sigma factor [Candidatus Poribacteria bacterium]|nr:sigma-70 family RNA polymerase sigma factor [Candidatus Poribacteria bacterium]MYB01168.1 sigma-70 family RNA polymerase sigma factor [Candidatus Poribacteria bacterium]
MHTNLRDEELIQRVQAGDESAFTELMSRYSPRVWKVVISNSRQRRDAEEILMDIWRAVWENISGLRSVGSFGAWLQRIAYNACTRYYASVQHSRSEIPENHADLADRIDQDAGARFRETELWNDLREAVFHLPDKVRNVAILYYLELWSIKEIHSELGLAIGTIKTQLRQTRELLRKEFGVELIREGIMSTKREGSKHTGTRIKVIGVGGAGGNAVNRMVEVGLTDIEFYVVNVDQQALEKCEEVIPVLIGVNTTPGYCGANPEIGKKAAEEDKEKLGAIVADADLVFIIAGMGGGTGAGASPLIASLAREQGALTVGVVTRPFNFEGQRRIEKAEQGLQELQGNADSVVVVPNQRLLDRMDRSLKIREAFSLSDEMLLRGVESITEFHTSTMRSAT